MEQLSPTIDLPELSSEQQQVVRRTLRSILDSQHFSKSKRYPALLEYLVLNTIDGNLNLLKERSVGMDVFGRPHTYDPSNDPIVRVAAGEVRRRIAVYYSEHPDSPVRIDLPLGRYTAEFHFPSPAHRNPVSFQPQADESAAQRPVVEESSLRKPQDFKWASRSNRVAWSASIAAAALLFTAGGASVWRYTHRPPQQDFWSPVLHDPTPALIVVGVSAQADNAQQWTPPSSATGGAATSNPRGTSVENAIAVGQICNIFRAYERACDMVSANRAQLPTLQNKTVVLIGRDNDWTHRILAPLRFRFQQKVPASVYQPEFIVDQLSKPNQPEYRLSRIDQPDTDYAVVGRFHSDITDGIATVAAGLTPNGTLGAAQFLSSSENVDQILNQAPKDWKGFNFEAVLQINVLNDSPGHVKVVATQFW